MAKSQEPEKRVESDSESAEDDEDAASSSSEDGSGSSESDSETEETKAEKKSSSLPPPAVKKSQPQPSAVDQESSSDDEESATESDEPGVGGVKPVASKPIDQKTGADVRNPRSKTIGSDSVKSSGVKRSGSAVKESEAKRSKKEQQQAVANVENSEKKSNEDSKKQLFQRLWSEGDEIVILKGMMEYTEKKKADPIADLKAFHDFIKADLHVEVTRAQLQAKIRRLRKKYENNKSKEKDGKQRVLSKPHEQKAYELSKLVWGNGSVKPRRGEKVVGSPKGSGKSGTKIQNKKGNNETNSVELEDPMEVEAVNGSKDKGISFSSVMMNVEESVLRSGEELFEGNKKFEGEQEWRKLRILEMEVYLKKLDLMRAQTKLVLDALKNSDQ